MGKNKKRTKKVGDAAAAGQHDTNPLLTAQKKFLASLPNKVRNDFFSNTHVTPEQRAEVWENQAELGEKLVNTHAWATPDQRLLKVFQHFGPVIEVGCGANAYWSKWMNSEGNVDVIALDVSLDTGGKISGSENPNKKSKKKKKKAKDDSVKTGSLVIRQGGPEALARDAEIKNSGRTLFLCYPDEEDLQTEEDDEEEDGEPPLSMAAACLEHFTGNTIIHVGELFGETISLDQAPFGRSSSDEFQQRLAAEYHCILKMKLENNWLHVRDTLSVWKRSEICCMAFENEDDDEDGEEDDTDEIEYKYIPSNEVLPVDLAAPCVAHLLDQNDDNIHDHKDKADAIHDSNGKRERTSDDSSKESRKKKKDDSDLKAVAGSKDDNDLEVVADSEDESDLDVVAGSAW